MTRKVWQKLLLFIYLFFLNEWEHRRGTMYPFSSLYSLKKRKRKALKRIKQIAKIFKKGNCNIYEEKKINHAIWSLRW